VGGTKQISAMGLDRIRPEIDVAEAGCLQEYLTKTRSQVGGGKEEEGGGGGGGRCPPPL